MSTRGVQDISVDMSTTFDNVTFSISSWYLIANTLLNRNELLISNQGANNDMATGTLYVSLSNSSSTETLSITSPKIKRLDAGSSISGDFGNDIKVNIRADTVNLNAHIQELDSIHKYNSQDS